MVKPRVLTPIIWSMGSTVGRPGLVAWIVVVGALLGATSAALAASGATLGSPRTLFWVVTVAATLCAIGAAVVIVRAYRQRLAEAGFLGAGLWAASVLPLVHGLSAPGVWFGPNTAVVLGAFLAVPAALLSAFPVLVPSWPVSRRLAPLWRPWVAGAVIVTTVLAAGLLAAPNALPAPTTGSVTAVSVSLVGGAAMLALSWRQLTLYWVSHRPATFVASVAFAFLGTTSLVWLQSKPFTLGWWLVHVLDIAGVLAACLAIIVSHRVGRPITELLAPVISRDPLVALEFGLSPVVHAFVADLDHKDPITRDHVIRTAETALRLGEQIGLSPARLRYLGLAGLLHDIGKLEIPDEILTKPGKLDSAEFELMQHHPEIGDRLLAAVPLLAPAAPIVRAHHERIDGDGYPDQLSGENIPLEARIISICDAYDAIVNTRHYRTGRDTATATAILRHHAGHQWDATLVTAAIPILATTRPAPQLDRVGRTTQPATTHICPDALPTDLVASATRTADSSTAKALSQASGPN